MPFEELRLIPGFNSQQTASMNAAGIVDGAFIRWKQGMAQKLGGWARFYPSSVGSPIRAVHPWEDLDLNLRLALGCTQGLKLITNGVLTDITPQTAGTDGPPNISSTAGSTTFTIVDPNFSNPTTLDWVFIHDQIFVGGVVLFGAYQITNVLGANTYQIQATQSATGTASTMSAPAAPSLSSVAGGALAGATYFAKVTYVNPSGETLPSSESSLAVAANNLLVVTSPIASGTATSYNVYVSTTTGTELKQNTTPIALGTNWTEPTSGLINTLNPPPAINSTGGSLPFFETTSGSALVDVILPNHGLTLGSTAFFLDPTTLGGVTIAGSYQVQTPLNSGSYTIATSTQAASTTSGFQNSGNLVILYYVAIGPQPTAAGYGVGTYGSGAYGIGIAPAQGAGTPITATDWSLINFGEILIANPAGGPLYQWQPEGAIINANIIGTAPITADGIELVMPEQIIIAWQTSFNGFVNPLRLSWCDAGNFNVWTPTATNFAGGFIIPLGSKIVSVIQGPNGFTVHTDIGAWSGQFVGQPLVFSIIKNGEGCGLVGRKAGGFGSNGVEYWMSQQDFFAMPPGGSPTPLPCSVWDYVFQRIDRPNFQNVRFFANSQFEEIGWFFPISAAAGGNGSGENANYVKYNFVENLWDYGPMGRSAWTDQSILGPPIGGTSGGIVYQHEISNDADGVAMMPFLLTGFYNIERAQQFGFIDYFIPDAIYGFNGQPQTANLQISFLFRSFPNDAPVIVGPINSNSSSTWIEPRGRGRLLQYRIGGSDLGSWWRMGLPRARIAPDGRNP
jgi:hypothetical protein